MWEAIRANRRRSFVLITAMALVLVGLGASIGGGVGRAEGAYVGIAAALLVWFVLWMTALLAGRGVLLGSMRAREIQHDDHPVLFNIVEEMTIASGLPKMPKVYIMDTDAPNAFAVGTEQNSAVAVTTGLLMRLSRDELQGVVAHEMGHVKNHDTRFMMLAGVMMGAIILIADVFVRGMFYSGRGRRRGGRGGGQAQAILLLVALLFAILAPILAQLLYFACSRRREFLADASGARFTRYPDGLASALEKIEASAEQMGKVNRAVAPMLTVNPLKGSRAHSLFSTHPPTEERVRVLRSMGSGAAFADYEAAYARVEGGHLIGARTLTVAERVSARPPSAEPEKDDLDRARDAVDILHRMDGFLFLPCACGLKIKVPPGYKGAQVQCPRCSRSIPIPAAVVAAAAASGALDAAGREEPPRSAASPADVKGHAYRYTPGRWQSFRCPCGRAVNLSPTFAGTHVACPACGREITIEKA